MSNSVRLRDLNDFIAPSQKCVNPLFSDKTGGQDNENGSASAGGGLVLQLEPDEVVQETTAGPETKKQQIRPDLIKLTTKQKATVTLNDCLACSGCITSAETLLIQEQSIDRFRAALASSELYDMVIVSISPQVIDAAIGEEVAIIESRAELMAKVKAGLSEQEQPQQDQKGNSSWHSPRTSVPVSSTTQMDHETRKLVPVEPRICQAIPMLVSACPGWVCYAEKTAPECIPYMSTVKSPQQILGTIVKCLMPSRWDVHAKRVYHATVMPCFDRKLEASRLDFFHQSMGNNKDQQLAAAAQQQDGGNDDFVEVDLVITTQELQQLLEEEASISHAGDVSLFLQSLMKEHKHNGSADERMSIFHAINEGNLRSNHPIGNVNGKYKPASRAASSSDNEKRITLYSHTSVAAPGGTSGGYVDYIFRYAAKELGGVELDPSEPLPYKQVRKSNPDLYEICLSSVHGDLPPLWFALAYGFRNIQTILSQLKRGKCQYHLVEIMACPEGCINGGGQPKPDGELPQEMRSRARRVATIMAKGVVIREPEDNDLVHEVYCNLIGQDSSSSSPLSPAALKYFHTAFHAVPKMESVAPLMVSW